MAFQIDPNIPLQANKVQFDPAAILMQAQQNGAALEKHRFEMQKLREDYDLAKEQRKQQKAMQMGIASDLAGIQSGSPAQYAPTRFEQTPQRGQMPQSMTGVMMREQGQQMPQAQAFGEEILNGDFRLGGGEVTQEAVAGREPLPIDFLKSALKQAMLNRDYDNALKFQKAIQESEKTTNEYYGGLTEGVDPKTGQPVLLAMTKTGAVPSGYAPRQKDGKAVPVMENGRPKTVKVPNTNEVKILMSDGTLMSGGSIPKPEQQTRQPRLQQVTDTTGTYIVDLDTGETRPILVNGKPVAKPLPSPSGEESNAAGFLVRMKDATKLLDTFESSGKPNVLTSFVSGVPFVGGVLERGAQTKEQQQYKNAALAWIRAKLRKESGAAIGNVEAEQEYQNYFPVVGDTSEVIAQKRSLRQSAMDEMRLASGKAAVKVDEVRPSSAMVDATVTGKTKIVKTRADLDKVKSGESYIAPDGKLWVKP